MAVRKVSVSMPEELVESALESAARKGLGLSGWLTEAAREQLRAEAEHDEGYRAAMELVLEHETDHGPIPQEAKDWADAIVAAAFPVEEQIETERSAS